ncbi:MAG TPA: septum formation initiator family protein [Verrucomicrobiae bacterium]|nr:septum formation initiator family protein [Verrucomicrobiae bacterium]
MNVDLGIWSTLTKIVVGLVVLAILLLIGMCYLPLIEENDRMRTEIYKLDQQIAEETNQLNQIQAQVNALQNDPKTLERLARQMLDYAKPDETVVHFETNGASGN